MWQPGKKLSDVEKEAVQAAMTFFGGNKTRTSDALGICINTLNSKLKEYEPNPPIQQASDDIRAPAIAPMEPIPGVPSQRAVPVPERKEIQKVPPSKSARRNS